MFELLLTAGLWFWILFALASAIVITALENDHNIFAFLGLCAWGLIWWLSSGHTYPSFGGTVEWFNLYWAKCIIYVVLYVFIGVLWSIFKFYLFCMKIVDEVKSYSDPSNREDAWKTKTEISYNTNRLMTWMTYWPWSMFWFLLNDPIKRLYRFIYNRLEGVYQGIADSVYKSRFK